MEYAEALQFAWKTNNLAIVRMLKTYVNYEKCINYILLRQILHACKQIDIDAEWLRTQLSKEADFIDQLYAEPVCEFKKLLEKPWFFQGTILSFFGDFAITLSRRALRGFLRFAEKHDVYICFDNPTLNLKLFLQNYRGKAPKHLGKAPVDIFEYYYTKTSSWKSYINERNVKYLMETFCIEKKKEEEKRKIIYILENRVYTCPHIEIFLKGYKIHERGSFKWRPKYTYYFPRIVAKTIQILILAKVPMPLIVAKKLNF